MIAIADQRGIWMFLAWYDPDKKKSTRQKLAEAIDRYQEKFGASPELAVVSPAAAAELGDADLPLPVETAPYIPRWTFYVGVRDEEARR